jgi:hypothetical protein
MVHATLNRVTSIIDPFPLSRSPSPSDPGYIAPIEGIMCGEDSVSLAHEREEEELALKERGYQMEVESVPVLVDDDGQDLESRMSTPSLAGSEFQGPLLTDSACMKLAMEDWKEEQKEKKKEKEESQPEPSFFEWVFGTVTKSAEIKGSEKYFSYQSTTAQRWEKIRRGNNLAESQTFQAPVNEDKKAQRERIRRQWKSRAESRDGARVEMISRAQEEKRLASKDEKIRAANMMFVRAVPFDSAARLINKDRAKPMPREEDGSISREYATEQRVLLKSRAESRHKARVEMIRRTREERLLDAEEEEIRSTNIMFVRAVPFDSAARLIDKDRARPIPREEGGSISKEYSSGRRASSKFGNDGSRSMASAYDGSVCSGRTAGSVLSNSRARKDSQSDTSSVDDGFAKAPIKSRLATRTKYKRSLIPAEVDELQRHSRVQTDMQQHERPASKRG